jgi:hypothetical protein
MQYRVKRSLDTYLDRAHGAPIKLHRAANPVDPRPDHHDVFIGLEKKESAINLF